MADNKHPTDIIQWARTADLTPAVAALAWPDPSYMYLERVPHAWLTEAEIENGLRLEKLDPAEDWNGWERGRLFCADFELRWETLDGAFQAVYVGPPADLPGFALADDIDLGDTQVETHSYWMWGNRVPDKDLETVGAEKRDDQNVFIEFVVPRVLYYPVSDAAQRVKLRVRQYVDQNSGALAYYRFCGLEELT
ncbi:MAG: type III-D CRISPR-associated protein Csx19 [Anaerolineae bacterium]